MILRVPLLVFFLATSASISHSLAFAQDIPTLKAGVVRVENKARGTVGSGFIVKIDRELLYIVTSSHVVKGNQHPDVYLYNRQQQDPLPARLIFREDENEKGLALLILKLQNAEMASGLKALSLIDSSQSEGEAVKIIGFPDGTSFWTVSPGQVERIEGNNLVFSGPIRGGNSGGPIVLSNGRVAGMVTDTIESQASSYAARAEIIVSYINGLVPKLVVLDDIVRQSKAELTTLITLSKIEVIHDGNKFGSGSWDFRVSIDQDPNPIFYFRESNHKNGTTVTPDSGKRPQPIVACARGAKEVVLKVVGTRSLKGAQAIGQTTVPCDHEGDLPFPTNVRAPKPKNDGSFDFYFNVSHRRPPAAPAEPSVPGDEFCQTLSRLVTASKDGFYSIVGVPSISPNTFHPQFMMPGAVNGFVVPKERVYNYLFSDREKGKVESQFYIVVSKVRACLPDWEEKEETSSTNRFHRFRKSQGMTVVNVYYDSAESLSLYNLTLSVDSPGRGLGNW